MLSRRCHAALPLRVSPLSLPLPLPLSLPLTTTKALTFTATKAFATTTLASTHAAAMNNNPTAARRFQFSTVANTDNIQNVRPSKSYPVVIVGGGSAGIAVAAQLSRYPFFKDARSSQCLIVEPRDTHYYQPLWYSSRYSCISCILDFPRLTLILQ
jgi:hypothetical protein